VKIEAPRLTESTSVASGIHHVALRTPDVDVLVSFYVDVFGLAVVRDSRPRSVWLTMGEDAVLMIEQRRPGEPAVAARSMEMFAFAVTSERKARIRADAVQRGCLDGETGHTVYLRDPDGRRVGASTYPLVF